MEDCDNTLIIGDSHVVFLSDALMLFLDHNHQNLKNVYSVSETNKYKFSLKKKHDKTLIIESNNKQLHIHSHSDTAYSFNPNYYAVVGNSNVFVNLGYVDILLNKEVNIDDFIHNYLNKTIESYPQAKFILPMRNLHMNGYLDNYYRFVNSLVTQCDDMDIEYVDLNIDRIDLDNPNSYADNHHLTPELSIQAYYPYIKNFIEI